MTPIEKAILEKYPTEIATATGEARTALVNEWHLVLSAIERRLALVSKLENAAESTLGKVAGAVQAIEQSVVNHAEGLLA